MKSRSWIILGVLGVALLGALSFDLADSGDDAEPRAVSVGGSDTGQGISDRRVRESDRLRHRMGELQPEQEDEDVLGFTMTVQEGTDQSEPELEWDAASSEGRRARAREAVAEALGRDAPEEHRARAAQLLAAARADFFTSEDGQTEFVALEQSIGD
jgi:hypothetical protein